MNHQCSDFFLDLKLPTHLPNEKPVPQTTPSSLPAKPPASLPSIPRHEKSVKPAGPDKEHITNPEITHIADADDHRADEFMDEEKFVTKKPNDFIPIPGTSIVLQTEEDIAKWIEERKKNWPSKKRIEEKAMLKTAKRGLEDDGPILSNKRPKRYCKFFIKGNCRNKDCPNLHEIPMKPLPNNRLVYHNDVAINVPERYTKSVNSGRSLHNLVVEHDHYRFENTKILTIIEKLTQHGYIKQNYEAYKR